MSCYVKIKTRITELDLLLETLEELGFAADERPGEDRRGDRVFSVTGRDRGRHLHFDVVVDEGQAARLLGDNQDLTQDRINEIHRVYAEKLVVREAKARGFSGIERRTVGGEVVLTVRKWIA